MIDWLHNPRAEYVLAAYSIALLVLAGLALFSWYRGTVQSKKWQQLQQERKESRRDT